MPHVGSDLNQRLQNEPALLHCRMRNPQSRLVDDMISKQHNVNINLARAFILQPHTPHRRLDPQRNL